jgi:hypothetical protein
MLRNNRTLPLIPNGRKRPGQLEHHTAECQMEDYGIVQSGSKPYRCFWCATHGQWAHETPVKVTYTFDDGTEITQLCYAQNHKTIEAAITWTVQRYEKDIQKITKEFLKEIPRLIVFRLLGIAAQTLYYLIM